MEDMHIHLKSGVKDISKMKQYIEKCIEMNINKVLFLDHGNRISENHIAVLNSNEVITRFLNNIKKVKKEYPKMEINAGIEIDFSYDKEFQEREINLIKKSKFDLVIGSVHGMNKEPFKYYLKAILDMINIYPINIIGHITLRNEYLEYNDLIEKIVKKATEKGILIEINTSERTRWNIQQLEYMLNLFSKYGTRYTIGSDAHKVEEIGYNIKETYTKIEKIKNHAERDIEYSIVSRGTEKYGSLGYMGITREKNDERLFVLAKHYDKYIDTYKDSFKISAKYKIENIAISRFELMSALTLNPFLDFINDNILIVGLGNLGFTALIHLLKKGFKNFGILTKDIKEFQKNGIKKLNKLFNANIKISNEYKNFNTYIEATGSSNVIKNILENTNNNSNIFLIGTPKDETYFINPLDINRKSLKIIGGHELNGHTNEERKILFNELLEENEKFNLKTFVSVYKVENNIVRNILQNKNNFIEVIKYDI